MALYKGIWYTPEKAVKEEDELIFATSAEEARRKFWSMYTDENRPAPLISIMKIEQSIGGV